MALEPWRAEHTAVDEGLDVGAPSVIAEIRSGNMASKAIARAVGLRRESATAGHHLGPIEIRRLERAVAEGCEQ